MTRFALATSLALVLLLGTCAPPPENDAVTEWEYSLANPTGTKLPVRPGDRLTIVGDSAELTSRFFANSYRMAVLSEPVPGAIGLVLDRPGPRQLTVRFYKGDTLTSTVRYDPYLPPPVPPTPGQLSGQTYLFSYDGRDTFAAHFDTGSGTYPLTDEVTDFYVDLSAHRGSARSHIAHDRHFYTTHYFIPLKVGGLRFANRDHPGLGAFQQDIGFDADGNLVAAHIQEKNGALQRRRLQLTAAPSVLPADVDEAELADRLSESVIRVDKSYSPADSASLEFAYTDDYERRRNGLGFEESDLLRISAEPGGDFALYVHDKVLLVGKWALTADRNLIKVFKAPDQPLAYLPITHYGPDRITLRYPLRIKTASPRGKQLESYVTVDALLTLTPDPAATSR